MRIPKPGATWMSRYRTVLSGDIQFPINAANGYWQYIAWWGKKYMVRIIAGCLLLAVGSVVLMTNSQEFRNLYGEPDLERYKARPGISVTVEYGSDHLPCNAMIESPQRLGYTQEQAPLMPSDSVTEVVEEIVPVAMRGNETNSMIHMSGCNEVHMTDYENIFIMRSTHTCDSLSHGQDVRTSMTFNSEKFAHNQNSFRGGSALNAWFRVSGTAKSETSRASGEYGLSQRHPNNFRVFARRKTPVLLDQSIFCFSVVCANSCVVA